MKLNEGSIYEVKHQRKGKFHLQIQEDGEWVRGVIVSGFANAQMEYNIKEEGEEITIRKEFCTFKEEERGE